MSDWPWPFDPGKLMYLPDPGGVWFVFGWDYSAYPIAVFADELPARRWSDEHGYGEVTFWPFGVEWSDHEK